MPIDVDTPESDGWWLQRLYNRLSSPERQNRLAMLDDWYRGLPPVLVNATKAQRDAVSSFATHSRTNFAKLVCEAVRERMTPVGIRTSADDDITGDAEAWRIWQRAGMPVESAEVHRTMFRLGDSYVIVGPPDERAKVPVITHEDPRQIITEHDPRQQRRVLAALKVFYDDVESADFCYLWRPGSLRVARRDIPRASNGSLMHGVAFAANLFSWDESRSMVLPDKAMLPVHRFRNEDGRSEFEPYLDLLRRINHETLQRMTISVYQAFKQRAAINLPDTDNNGNEIDYSDILVSDPGAFWQIPEGVEFWESASIDLSPILNAIKSDVEQLASVTRTPLHYLSPAGTNQSAEGAALSREGLVFKVEDRMQRCSATWSDVMSDAFLWMGDATRADLDALEIIWKPAERESLASRLDAATKATTAQVPWRTIMTDIIGFSPQRVDQMQAERMDDQILQAQLLAQTTAITAPAEAAAAAATAKASGAGGGGGAPKGMAAVNAARKGTSVPVANMPAKLQANAARAASGQRLIGQKT